LRNWAWPTHMSDPVPGGHREDGKGTMGDSEDGLRAAAPAGADDADGESDQRGLRDRLFGLIGRRAPNGDGDAAHDRRRPANTGPRPLTAIPGVGNLRRLRVDDIAIPKAEIVAVPVTISKAELVEVFRESGFSRLPVYKDTLDKPLGLVLLKDFALEHGFNGAGARFTLRKLLRPVLFVPPSMPLGVLLQKMQSERSHMALVIDEYGGVDGLVTIEDVIEQVVGEIEDEHDTAEDGYWVEEKPGCYLVQARAPVEDFEAETGLDLSAGLEDDDEVDTLGGLVFLLSGRVPARGEVLAHASGAQFEVVDADPRRIKRLRVRLPGNVPA